LSILEIGCGNGRAILELQNKLPFTHTYCINKEGYTFTQSTNKQDLLFVAIHYNISIPCLFHTNDGKNITSRVILPNIDLFPGIQSSPLPYNPASFDLILSQHALNEGKVLPNDIKIILPRIAILLKSGGYAALLLLYQRAHLLYGDVAVHQDFAVVHIQHVHINSTHRFSFYLYTVLDGVGIVIKRCHSHEENSIR